MGISENPGYAIKRRPADYAFNQDNLTIDNLAFMTIVKSISPKKNRKFSFPDPQLRTLSLPCGNLLFSLRLHSSP